MSFLFPFGRVRNPRSTQSTTRRRKMPLALETLEDRWVPTVFNVNSLADTLAPPAGVVTLRSAIQAANNMPGGNTINLTVAGDYRIALPGANTGTNNSGAFTILPTGGNLSIINTSGGAVDIDGAGLDRVFDINPQGGTAAPKFTVTIQGVTIENGLAFDANNPDGPNGSGGGIRDQGNASLTLINVAVVNNSASADGGGISMENTVSTPWTLTLNNSTVSFNRAGDAGGGVDEDGSGHVNINNSVITNNSSTNQGAGVWLDAIAAGPVLQTATLNITGSNISSNTAIAADNFGGGVGNAGNGVVTITNSTLADNFSGGNGGGFGDQNGVGTLIVLNSTFVNNSAINDGGAIFESSATTTTIQNSTITGNTSQANAAGVEILNGTLVLDNTVIAGNLSGPMNFISTGVTAVNFTSRGGVVPYSAATTVVFTNATGDTTGTGAAATVTVSGGFITSLTITNPGTGYTLPPLISFVDPAGGSGAMATTTIGNIAPDIFATVSVGTGNFIGIGDFNLIGITNGTDGNQIGTLANPLNPLLGPLQNNGGLTLTRAPLPGSPLIDTGINTVVPTTDPITGNPITDRAALLRIVNARVDIGAVEFQPGATTTSLNVMSSTISIGQTVTLTAKVAVASAAPNNVPTGSVTFFNGTNALGTVTLDSTGTATLQLSTLPLGKVTLTAVYNPNTNAQLIGFTTSTSTVTILQVVAPKTIGAFDPTTATWFLRDSNSPGSPTAGQFQYGAPGWIGLTGDFTGDGQTTIVVVDPKTETWYIRNSNTPGTPDITPFQFGEPGWIPIVGDWNGSGKDGIGVFDPTTGTFYLRNEAGPGNADAGTFMYGAPGWIPVVGNWAGNANGLEGIGVVDPTTETWYLRNELSGGSPDAGKFVFGMPGWKPVVGDWTGTGHDGIGAVNPATETWYLRNELSGGSPDAGQFAYGAPGWTPVTGQWDVPGTQHLFAAGVGPGAPTLSNAALQATVQEALTLLKNEGVSQPVLQELATANYSVGELPASVLGETFTQSDAVVISDDAAGYGWYTDEAPQDPAFSANGVAQPGSPAAGHEDLLTTVLHEMGHLVGLPDVANATSGSDLMDAVLPVGVRRTDALDLVFGSGVVS